jgi:U3 small nucleolar RNA-associated protein 4
MQIDILRHRFAHY